MTATEAYDDCIKQAREGANRQRVAQKNEANPIMAQLYSTAATTLESFADMMEKIKAIRCAS